jgi:GNAT superfamily N-acetyltransferase
MWKLSLDPALVQLDVVYPWLRDAYWSTGVRRDVVERAFAHSIVCGAYDERGAQLGIARAVTDFATFAWLADVFVAPEARGQGIARAMVQALIDDPRCATLRRWTLATRDAHDVYAPLGFRPPDAPIFMQLLLDATRWRDPAL